MLCYQTVYASIKFVIKIHGDFCRWSGKFCLIFAFSLTTCYNSNALPQFGMSQYNSLNVQSWLKFQNGDSFTRNDQILNSMKLMISKIQRSWRQFCDVTFIWSFQTGLETTIFEAQVNFRHPFAPNSLFAFMLPRTGWVGAPKPTLSPGAGNPRYPLVKGMKKAGNR